MQTSERSPEGATWARLCLGVSGALILVTGANAHLPALTNGILGIEEAGAGWRFLEPFNLAHENNLAAWWSGALLLIAGLLSLQQVEGRGALPATSAAILAALLVGLSCDEVVSIHERVSLLNVLYLLPFAVLGAGLLSYAMLSAWKNPASRGVALRVSAGVVLLGSVALQEYLEHNVSWPSWLTGVRVAVEEGTELLGMFIILRALVTALHGGRRVGVRRMLPKPSEFPVFLPLLAFGLGLQLASAFFVFSHLDDLTTRGNATSWYCATVYLVAACRVNERELGTRPSLLFFTLVFCSLDAVGAFSQYIPKLFPSIGLTLPLQLFEPAGAGRYAVHMLLLGLTSFLAPLYGQNKAIFGVLSLVGIAASLMASKALQLAVPGLLAFAVTVVIVKDAAPRSPAQR